MAQHPPAQLERLPPTPTEGQDDLATFPPRPSLAPPSATTDAPALPGPPTAQGMRRTPSQGSNATIGAKVWGLALVGFDHALGPTIEYTLPDSLRDNPELQRNLPFLALPDGAHARDEDYSYFHLLLPSVAPGETIFGISCNRQIPADQLLNKGKDVTRSTVQKAIVVLASKVRPPRSHAQLPSRGPQTLTRSALRCPRRINQPIFGPLRDKLGVVTRTFFAQRNFDDKAILVDLFRSFDPALRREGLDKGKGRADDDDVESGKGEDGPQEKERAEAASAAEPPLSPPPEEKQRAAEEEGGMYMGASACATQPGRPPCPQVGEGPASLE